MKYLITLQFIAVCSFSCTIAMVPPSNDAVSTLAQELDAIARMIPITPIRRLATGYLLNDEQCQAFVRIINSNDAYITQTHFRSQPEVMQFINWVRNQILLSGGELQLEESEEFFNIFNRSPFESNTVFGWQGIVKEFLRYYPEDMIRNHVEIKMAENGIFAEFIQRLQALKPVYDRITALPEAQRLAAILAAKGINVSALDTFIRNQFGWQTARTSNATVTGESAISTVGDFAVTTGLPVPTHIPAA